MKESLNYLLHRKKHASTFNFKLELYSHPKKDEEIVSDIVVVKGKHATLNEDDKAIIDDQLEELSSSVKETSKLILRRMGIRARNGLLVHGIIIDMRSTNQLILSEVLGNDAMKQ